MYMCNMYVSMYIYIYIIYLGSFENCAWGSSENIVKGKAKKKIPWLMSIFGTTSAMNIEYWGVSTLFKTHRLVVVPTSASYAANGASSMSQV